MYVCCFWAGCQGRLRRAERGSPLTARAKTSTIEFQGRPRPLANKNNAPVLWSGRPRPNTKKSARNGAQWSEATKKRSEATKAPAEKKGREQTCNISQLFGRCCPPHGGGTKGRAGGNRHQKREINLSASSCM